MLKLYEQAQKKLNPTEIHNDEKELETIKLALMKKDIVCRNLSLRQIQDLWDLYSQSYCASWMSVTKDTINDFIDWLS